MANERTFLAWIRTAIGVMAFGFVVEEFAFAINPQPEPTPGLSQLPGLILVAFGGVLTVLSFVRYRTIEKELEAGTYSSNFFLTSVLTIFVIAVGIFLFVYLIDKP